MNTLEEHLRHYASVQPGKTALKCGNESLSYAKLYALACREATALRSAQKLVPIVAIPGMEFVVSYLAAHIAGCTAVPLDKATTPQRLEQIKAMLLGKAAPQGVADVLFTTGTTGKQKGVMVSHKAIAANAENLAEAQAFGNDLTFVVCGPLNHIGSLSKLYPTIAVGATLHIIDGLKDMDAFFRAIDAAPAKAASFLVPTSIRMLMAFAEREIAARSAKIDFIETGAAPMPLADMQQFCSLLPHSRLYNTYASTETGIVATFNYNGGECIAGCLGAPMRHSAIKITADGRVACTGDTLMSGYWEDDELTRSVMPGGHTVVTNDSGYIDSCGRLRLSGRNDDVINVGGYKVAPTDVEDAAMTSPPVRDCVCIAANHPVVGTVVKLLVVADGKLNCRELAKHLKTLLEPYQCPSMIEQVESVNRTFNGKIDRKSYRNGNS